MKKYYSLLIASIYLFFISCNIINCQEIKTYDYSDIEISIENFNEMTLWSIVDSCELANCNIAQKLGSAYSEIGTLMQANNVQFIYYPIVITHFFDFEKYIFEAGIPIPNNKANIKTTGRIIISKSPSGKMIKAVHKGPYNKVADTYNKIGTYMKDNGLKERDHSFEVYINDPSNTPEEELITWIYFPIE